MRTAVTGLNYEEVRTLEDAIWSNRFMRLSTYAAKRFF